MTEGVFFLHEGQLSVTESSWAITVTIPFADFIIDASSLVNHLQRLKALASSDNVFKINDNNASDITAMTINTVQDHIEQLFVRAHDLNTRVLLLIDSLRNPDVLSEYKRGRRSVLPIISEISHFLFGTARDVDIKELRAQLQKLGLQQHRIAHLVDKSMTLINITFFREIEDRRAINHLINTTNSLASQVAYLNSTMFRSDWTRSLRTLMIVQIQSSIHTALLAFTEIESLITKWTHTASELAQGHLPSGLITPPQLVTILQEVAKRLPQTFSLAIGANTDIMTYYKYLQAIPIPDSNVLHVVVLVPLRTLRDDFDVFRLIPTFMYLNNSVIKYSNLQKRLAVSINRDRYFIPDATNVESCLRHHLTTCPVNDPYISTEELSCEMALFMNETSWIDHQCRRLITVGTVRPSAVYLTNGNWMVFPGSGPVTLSVYCSADSPDNHNARHTSTTRSFHITSPRVITLASGCEGIGKYISLPLYFNRDSKISLNVSYTSELLNRDIRAVERYKALDERLMQFSAAVNEKPLVADNHLLSEQVEIPLASVQQAVLNDHPIFRSFDDVYDYMHETTRTRTSNVWYWVYCIAGVLVLLAFCVMWRHCNFRQNLCRRYFSARKRVRFAPVNQQDSKPSLGDPDEAALELVELTPTVQDNQPVPESIEASSIKPAPQVFQFTAATPGS